MKPEESEGWSWNVEQSEHAETEPRSTRKERVSAEVVAVGNDLLELAFGLRKLRERYLSEEERAQLADSLYLIFNRLRRNSKQSADPELRQRLKGFLFTLGALGVILLPGEEAPERVYTLLEAVENREVDQWVDAFYAGIHQTKEPVSCRLPVCSRVTEEVMEEEQKLRQSLMLWLEELNLV